MANEVVPFDAVSSPPSILETNSWTPSLNLDSVAVLHLFLCAVFPFLSATFYLFFRLMFGILYPAYASYKAVKTKSEKEYVKWMMYWIVFALFTCLETIADIFISFWFPFYYELKILFVLWLMSPVTKGSSLLYKKFVHPAFIRKEKEIDEYINRAKEQGYSTVLQMGSRGLNYATGVVVQTALRGQFSLVNQLRKSHSLTDISPSSNYAQLKSPELVETDADDQTETEFQPSRAISRPKRQLRVVKSKSSPEKFSEEDETTSVDQDDDDDDVDYIVQRKIKRPAQRRNTANLPMTSEKSKSQEYTEGEGFSDDTTQSKSKLLRSKSLQTSKKYSTHSEVGAYATMPRTRHKGTGKKRPPLNIH